MTIESQLADYGRYLRQEIDTFEVPAARGPAVRPVVPSVAEPRRWGIGWPAVAVAAASALALIVLAMVWRPDSTVEPSPDVGQMPGGDGLVVLDPIPVIARDATFSAPVFIGFEGEASFSRSGDTMWAFQPQGDGEILQYRNGEWEGLPTLSDSVLDVTGDPNGTVWAVTRVSRSDRAVWRLDDDVWRRFDDVWTTDVEYIELEGETGTLWAAMSDELFSWDGMESIHRAGPPQGLIMDTIAITPDGMVWTARFNPFFEDLPAGLARYHPDVDEWEWVRPLGGSDDVPAVLGSAPNGDLWVLLEHYRRDETAPALAHLDVSVGEWTIAGLPMGATWQSTHGPGGWAADDTTFWLTRGDDTVLRFDGRTWTAYHVDTFDTGTLTSIRGLAVASDGTVWLSTTTGIRELILEGIGG